MKTMITNLRLVSSNPQQIPEHHHDGAALHRLALRLTAHVRAGNTHFAHALAGIEALTPIEMGIVSCWMVRAGIDESQILTVMVGDRDAPPKSTDCLSA
jgi:hypothetical protein